MPANIKNLLNNIKDIYLSDSNLETLLDYERVLDEMDLYAFKNWRNGELLEGPIYEKYFITCKWKFNYREMPDPAGGERLLNYGCEIYYETDEFEYPIEVHSPDDFKPGTKVGKLVSKPIWVVTITVPKRLMSEIEKGSIELENEILDKEEIESAAEQGQDDDVFQNDRQQAQPQVPQLNAL
jgi:hypothetical protein